MTLLFRIIYAAHANGTHHKLALDALWELESPHAEQWRRLFLAHAELYLEGSKAPDKQFKDFKNHVLHVHDGFWGGAPEKAESWYALLVRALVERNWSEAVWCAGILSHYYTDPIHPFHTAQSEAENNIHRAVEWSISKSYDALRARGLKLVPLAPHEPGDSAHWLKDMVIAGAETSNRYYETLIANYDFARGVVEPPEGLSDVCRDSIGALLVYASAGFGKILDRAFAEAAVEPPTVSLTAETVVAALKIPVKWVTRKLADADDRRLVEAMYDELQDTGRVEKTLTEEDRTIRDLYAKEVEPHTNERLRREREQRLENAPMPQGALPFAPRSRTATPAAVQPDFKVPLAKPERTRLPTVTSVPLIQPVLAKDGKPDTPPASDRASRAPRFHLTATDDVEAAPSIGPRTASRLYEVGILTVADLLAAEPAAVAEELGVRHITAEEVADWQDQSRLVMEIPELRGTHAQLLVGAGLRTVPDVAGADPAGAQAAILKFAATREGQRILRDGPPPDLEKIAAWLANAREAQAA
jgi:predicted flap endonuclease-1-like 5' DNA nuclease